MNAGSSYEVELTVGETGERGVIDVTTRSDVFRIARTVELPSHASGPLVIDRGGSPENGYVLYRPAPGSTAVIDGGRRAEVNIEVEASYVIVRGVTLRNARFHGIRLGAVSDVVIEDCDISGWGENLEDGWGRNFDSAIFHETPAGSRPALRRITIQRNRLHHPFSNANSWLQPRASNRGSRHPIGPQAISFIRGDGEHVIRHNRIFSDFEHMFNDAMGEHQNFSHGGFPGRDSDIHGNLISHCWDDGIEIEGANLNVRCWGNVIDRTFIGIGAATTSLGPCYVFRNFYLHSRRGPGSVAEAMRGQSFLKLGADPRHAAFAQGRMYVLHNSVLQPPDPDGSGRSLGAERGLHLTGPEKVQINLVSRNNILETRDATGTAVNDPQKSPYNDFDYDLFNGVVVAVEGSERHGLRARPVFDGPIDWDRPWRTPLQAGSPGVDAGVRIPNFNDTFAGGGPDVGATESGGPPPAMPALP